MTPPTLPSLDRACALTDVLAVCFREVVVLPARVPLLPGSLSRLPTFVHAYLGDLPDECALAVWLNSAMGVVGITFLGSGTVDTAEIDTGRLVRGAAHAQATACVLVHNHPSGTRQFSVPDRQLTLRASALLLLVGVQLVDHLLVVPGDEAEADIDTCVISYPVSWQADLSAQLIPTFENGVTSLHIDDPKDLDPSWLTNTLLKLAGRIPVPNPHAVDPADPPLPPLPPLPVSDDPRPSPPRSSSAASPSTNSRRKSG